MTRKRRPHIVHVLCGLNLMMMAMPCCEYIATGSKGRQNGEWFEHVDGNIIDTIKWEEHWKYKISKSKVISKNMKLVCDGLTDYVPDATPWDELFDIENQPKGWVNTVESLAYGISIVQQKQEQGCEPA